MTRSIMILFALFIMLAGCGQIDHSTNGEVDLNSNENNDLNQVENMTETDESNTHTGHVVKEQPNNQHNEANNALPDESADLEDDPDYDVEPGVAFRDVNISGSMGTYTVTGEARVFEAMFAYAVSDGHVYFDEGDVSTDAGAPSWGTFAFEIHIDQDKLPSNGTLTLELFEYSAKDNSRVNEMIFLIETINITGDDSETTYSNDAFRHVKVTGENGKYTVTGQARVFEGVFGYAVSEGHYYITEGFTQISSGAPAWGNFTLTIEIDPNDLPVNGTLMLELFEKSAKDGSHLHVLHFPIDQFPK